MMPDPARWKLAAEFVDAIPLKRTEPSRFDTMMKAEIKMDRLRSRRLAQHGAHEADAGH